MLPIDKFYYDKAEPVRSCLLALKSIIADYDERLEARWYYGYPCFMFQKKIFCYLWIDRKTKSPYIGIGKGVDINHPDLITGKRTFISLLMIDPEKDIPVEKIYQIFDMVMKLY